MEETRLRSTSSTFLHWTEPPWRKLPNEEVEAKPPLGIQGGTLCPLRAPPRLVTSRTLEARRHVEGSSLGRPGLGSEVTASSSAAHYNGLCSGQHRTTQHSSTHAMLFVSPVRAARHPCQNLWRQNLAQSRSRSRHDGKLSQAAHTPRTTQRNGSQRKPNKEQGSTVAG